MYIYNVTVKVMHTIKAEWQQWMLSEHLTDMMQTGKFLSYQFNRLLEHDDEEGVTFIVQYKCATKQDYESYIADYSHSLRDKGYAKFGDQYIAFRTIMEVIAS
jgi:hypothetical protein